MRGQRGVRERPSYTHRAPAMEPQLATRASVGFPNTILFAASERPYDSPGGLIEVTEYGDLVRSDS